MSDRVEKQKLFIYFKEKGTTERDRVSLTARVRSIRSRNPEVVQHIPGKREGLLSSGIFLLEKIVFYCFFLSLGVFLKSASSRLFPVTFVGFTVGTAARVCLYGKVCWGIQYIF